jgi:hypothetical protein
MDDEIHIEIHIENLIERKGNQDTELNDKQNGHDETNHSIFEKIFCF